MFNKSLVAVALAGAAFTVANTADAKVFGPASGAIAVLGSPTVTLGVPTGTASFGSGASIFSTTGDLTSASGTGSASGTLTFSDVPLTVLPETLTDFMTFADTSGGNYTFDVSSVETIAYVTSPASTSITLYLLGTAEDTNLGLTPGPTSETLTINSTSGSAYSASASIAAPPSMGTPEPATWALMLIGFGGAGASLRSSRRQRSVA